MLENLTISQIILAVIAFVFILNGIKKFFARENKQTVFKFFVTLFIWGGILVLAIYPQLSHILSKKLNLGENLNTFIFIGFVVVFIIIFKLISLIEKLERNISEIVRQSALSELKKNKQRKT